MEEMESGKKWEMEERVEGGELWGMVKNDGEENAYVEGRGECRMVETGCHAPGIFRPSHTLAFPFLYPLYFKTLHFHKSRNNKGKDNSSIEDTRNAVLLLQNGLQV